MSISRRLFNMARSELNSLLDRASEAERRTNASRDPDEDLYRRYSIEELTDAELEAEIERRYRARQAAAKAATGPAQTRRSESAGSAHRPKASHTRPASERARKSAPPDELRLAYAALEVPYGADFATVRKSYRALMRKYHPDRHAGSPEKQKTATELAQKLTSAYALIEKRVKR
jgi:DnaJ-domain-containing protein 1